MQMELKLPSQQALANASSWDAIDTLFMDAMAEAASSEKEWFSWSGEKMLQVRDPNWGTPYPPRGENNSITTYSPESWGVYETKGKYSLVVTFRMTQHSFYEK